MVEEEKDSDVFKEIHELFSKEVKTGFSEYTKQMQSFGHIPENQFDHSWGLIHTPKKDVQRDEFNFLEDQDKYLGNVDDAKTLRFYQMDNFFLTNIFAMGQTDKAETLVFKVLWANFKSELRMTCNVEGLERSLQSFIPIVPRERGGILKKKKKRKATEYITPRESEEEAGNY